MTSRKVSATIEVNANVGTVFELISEPTLYERWVPGLVNVEVIDPGVEVGASSKATYRLNGQTVHADERVTHSNPPKSMTSEIEMPGVTMVQDFRLEEATAGTSDVTVEATLVRMTAARRLQMAIASTDLEAQLRLALERLKAVAEDPNVALPPVERIPLRWSAVGVATFVAVMFALGFILPRLLT